MKMSFNIFASSSVYILIVKKGYPLYNTEGDFLNINIKELFYV